MKIGGDSFYHTHKHTHTPSHPSPGRVNKRDSEQHILNSIFFSKCNVSNILCVPTLTILLAERLFFVVAAAILVVFNSMALF